MASLPYVTATGNVDKALSAIKQAATPTSVSQDFVKTVLNIRGGSGNQITSFLRKIGFAGADGTPTSIYTRFRSTDSEASGGAAAEALKIGYSALYKRNEYMHQLSDEKLKGLIIEETGAGGESSVVNLIINCIKSIKKYANFDITNTTTITEPRAEIGFINNNLNHLRERDKEQGGANGSAPSQDSSIGLNLSYTINLNLPATSDIAVFNAIFKSLKENLLRNSND
ncbi:MULTISPECIES: DUF5343 domain-containing protein [unclassified Burkholderia]|uniref:DUF5343 domain-containing protein n=1 Tax=unclassified Burkholderia TaxID=2613784 RepID=UPI0014231785|nr:MULTISPECIES: DUF5343 domain-containing protein [unclassified Burkholderia]NIE84671.1 hypothetical protein [Burkholderia sp. Tr-860]NIF63577.1 hypothetical protein [Burkholderia sp. Cy-647]NIF97646.1 hypothetical protein [Burkholderia sp. Ax-1720]